MDAWQWYTIIKVTIFIFIRHVVTSSRFMQCNGIIAIEELENWVQTNGLWWHIV